MGCTVGHFGLASYLYFNQIGYDLTYLTFIPLASLGLVVFIAAAGIIPLSHVCRVENLPTKVQERNEKYFHQFTKKNLQYLFNLLTDSNNWYGNMHFWVELVVVRMQ